MSVGHLETWHQKHGHEVIAELGSQPDDGLTTNLQLIGAILLAVVAQLAVIYVPTLSPIFKTSPLSLPDLFDVFRARLGGSLGGGDREMAGTHRPPLWKRRART